MVFVLRHVLNGEILILGHNQTYSLGRSRKNSIHLLDITVDKMHAELEVLDEYASIKDKNSEFGTWVNRQRINEQFRLRDGDVIVFGKKDCKYVFLDPRFQVMIDAKISQPIRKTLIETLRQLHIEVVDYYNITCTHFVTELVSLNTLKEEPILHYLIDRKTVVVPQFFNSILNNIKEAPVMPNIYRYMPEICHSLKEKGIEELNPKKKRRHVFEDIVFIFLENMPDPELESLILKSGGEMLLYSASASFCQELLDAFSDYKYIAVGKQPISDHSFLKGMKKKVTLIREDEIYISILKGELAEDLAIMQDTNLEHVEPSTSSTQPTMKDIITQNHAKSKTLHTWLSLKTKKKTKVSPRPFNGKKTGIVINPIALQLSKDNQNKSNNKQSNEEVERLEINTIEDTRNELEALASQEIVSDSAQNKGEANEERGDFSRLCPSEVTGVNPYVHVFSRKRSTRKPVDKETLLETYRKKFKNINIELLGR